MPRYLITQRSYLAGRIVEKGETIDLPLDVVPGEHMIFIEPPRAPVKPVAPVKPAAVAVPPAPIAQPGLAAPPPQPESPPKTK